MQTFRILAKKPNAIAIYGKWIDSIAPALIDPTIQIYSSINLSDKHQRDSVLFPLFKYNMHIIDFWLSNVVFLHEAISFESKLMCTAWDLCGEHLKNRVTGFSGTNDTKGILPLPIAQNDLDELKNTNENVRKILLQPENQCYRKLPSNVNGQEILQMLRADGIPVLIDSGALLWELNNLQVAKEWLKLFTNCPLYEAVIYFDERDVLQTIDRNDVVTDFDCSVYRENLNRCLVYLDDSHTRGTDLKFPPNWRACVTLSGDITRDKTVQACMRMRQLGRGHSIAFWASFEADLRIREIFQFSPTDQITNEHVVEFICNNSRIFEIENTVHWAAAALNYTKKLAAHKLYERSCGQSVMKQLYEKVVDKEFVTLTELYGGKELELLSNISRNNFEKLAEDYRAHSQIVNFIETIDQRVSEKLSKINIRCFARNLDEEQEKELEISEEHEIEKQYQIQWQQNAEPAKPIFDDRLIQLIQCGLADAITKDLLNTKTLLPLTAVLKHTKMFEPYNNFKSPWANYLAVTKDFAQVIQHKNTFCDRFLRPIWWIAHISNENENFILLLLSSYEADRLLPHFRKSTKSTLFPFRSRMSKLHSDLMHENNLQVTGSHTSMRVNAKDKAQIQMFSGSMYFNDEDEQNAYCNFLGLIPRPRTSEQETAFERELIRPNGFVPIKHRQNSKVAKFVNQCKFEKSPIGLAKKLIEAHHDLLHQESQVAAILERGEKKN